MNKILTLITVTSKAQIVDNSFIRGTIISKLSVSNHPLPLQHN